MASPLKGSTPRNAVADESFIQVINDEGARPRELKRARMEYI